MTICCGIGGSLTLSFWIKGSRREIMHMELQGMKMLRGSGQQQFTKQCLHWYRPAENNPGCKHGKLRTGPCIHGASSLELSHHVVDYY